jgi:hypothetical protein
MHAIRRKSDLWLSQADIAHHFVAARGVGIVRIFDFS